MQCSAKLENGDRCPEICETDKQFCLDHSRKFYNSYMSYKQICNKAENRQQFVDDITKANTSVEISDQISNLLKAYASAEKCYEMRKLFIDTNVHPDAQDKGHKNEKHYWKNLIAQYEDLLFVLFEKQQSAEEHTPSRVSQSFATNNTSNTSSSLNQRAKSRSGFNSNTKSDIKAQLKILKDLRPKCKPIILQLIQLFSNSEDKNDRHYNEMILDDDKFYTFVHNTSSEQVKQLIEYCVKTVDQFEIVGDIHADLNSHIESLFNFKYSQSNVDYNLIQQIIFDGLVDIHLFMMEIFEKRKLNVMLCQICKSSLNNLLTDFSDSNKKKYLSTIWKLTKGLDFSNFSLIQKLIIQYTIYTFKIEHVIFKGRLQLLLKSESNSKQLASLILTKLKWLQNTIQSTEAKLEKDRKDRKETHLNTANVFNKLAQYLDDSKPSFEITKELANIMPTKDQTSHGFADFFE